MLIASIAIGIVVVVMDDSKMADDAYNSTNTSNPVAQSAPTTPAQTAKVKTWVQVVTFSGDSAKRSEPFTLTGADARLKYTQTGSEYATSYIYLVKKGDSLEKSGGFPETTITGPKTDETRLVKDAGDYYFDINSSSATWTVSVEEYR